MGIGDFSSGIDSDWKQYEQGALSADELLKKTKVTRFAQWAESKILKDKEKSPVQPASLKKLAEELSPVDPEASQKIHEVFTRISVAHKDLGSGEKATIEVAEAWNKSTNTDFLPLLSLFKQNNKNIEQFIEWSHDNVITHDDISKFDSLYKKIALGNRRLHNPDVRKLVNRFSNMAVIKSELEKFPENQRADLSRSMWPFLQNSIYNVRQESDLYQVPELLQALSTIQPEQRPEAVKHTISFEQWIDRPLLAGILQAIGTTPPERMTEVKEHTTSLLKAVPYRSDSVTITYLIRTFPPERRADLLSALSSISTDPVVFAQILLAMGGVPSEQSTTLKEQITSLLQGVQEGRSEILIAVSRIPSECKVDVLRHALASLKSNSNGIERGLILTAIHDLPPEQVTSAIERYTSRLQAIPNVEDRRIFLETVSHILEPEQRHSFAETLGSLLGTMSEGRSEFLRAVRQIPSERTADVIRHSFAPLQGITNGVEGGLILTAIEDLPLEQVPAAIARYISWLQAIPSGEDRRIFLETVSQILRPEQRHSFAARLESLLRTISDAAERTAFLRALYAIEPDARVTLLTERPDQNVTSIMNAIAQMNLSPILPISQSPYQLNVVPDEFEKNPRLLLDTLTDLFSQEAQSFLQIHYEGEAGIDAGGLGRQFISDLFSGVLKQIACEKDSESNLYRPKLQEPGTNDQKVYRQLANVMMFCLTATRAYPIGVLFDESVFIAIKELRDSDLAREFDEVFNEKGNFEELFRVYEVMNSTTELGRIKMKNIKESLKGATAQEKEDFASDYLRPELALVFELAKGMKSSPFTNAKNWQVIRQMEPSQLSEKLQGSIAPKAIIEKLHFDAGVPPEKQQWLKEWIETASPEQIKQFLYTLTGSNAIASTKISIHDNSQSEKAPLYFHTCFNAVDVPFAKIASKEDFKAVFEATLGGSKKYTRA